jgi:CCR4-NOT transcription complex subunit 1
MPKLLSAPEKQGWSTFHKLLISLFRFLSPFLSSASMHGGSAELYKGTLRILLVLLHDFPEFLSEYYYSLCDALPARCVQMRSIILSAFPADVTPPDANEYVEPAGQNMTVPPIASDMAAAMRSSGVLDFVTGLLATKVHTLGAMEPLKEKIVGGPLTPGAPSNTRFNVPLINSVVAYLGTTAVGTEQEQGAAFVSTDPAVAIIAELAAGFDTEGMNAFRQCVSIISSPVAPGQYHIVTAMAMHLRYPNAHTFWFRDLVLHLFLHVKDERFQEVIVRVLLERVIAHRPHPWGSLTTFTELVRNPKYAFKEQPFFKLSRDVELLLENVRVTV